MVAQGAAQDHAAASQDQLRFANGDSLMGFVEAISARSITFTPQNSTEKVEIELSRLDGMKLANAPLAQGPQNGLMVLADGSRLRVSHITIERAMMQFVPVSSEQGQVAEVELRLLRRLDLAQPGRQLVALADLPVSIDEGASVFTAAIPMRKLDDTLFMHAPMIALFQLPAGAVSVTARATVDVAADDTQRSWTDFEVMLMPYSEGTAAGTSSVNPPRASLTMSASSPTGRLHIPLPGDPLSTTRKLQLTLDPLINGPIMDRMKLDDAWVLVKSTPAE